ncbi:MAG: GNAT family N-acetyltransferase [Holophaga sp.]|jgi:N-acetylglutamate synthase-like GNAT family acetyltransferase
MNIRVRRPEDMEAVRAMLEAADLPLQGLEDSAGWVAEEDGRLLGHVALEPTADAAVLRSLVVIPEAQGRGLARLLTERVEREAGPRILVLRTQTVGPWVERRGYRRVALDQVPASVWGTSEFLGSLCACCPIYVKGAVPESATGAPASCCAPAGPGNGCGG